MTMKKLTVMLAALLIVITTASAQNGAEVSMKMTMKQGTGNLKVYFREGSVRNETSFTTPQMTFNMITLVKAGNKDIVYKLDPDSKTYSEIKPGNGKSDEKCTAKVMGNETVMGYACKHVMITKQDGTTSEWWTSKDVLDYEKYSHAFDNERSNRGAADKALKEAGAEGFPVKMIEHGKDGDVTMELVKAEKKNLDASLFEIPAGYTKSGSVSPGQQVNPADLQKMTPEERAKYIEEMKKKYGAGGK